uniref:GRAM domain-containing protein n=1 Tax=Vitis vinifera TaxID=29760 RepID=A5BS77_VITVI|nr:hypothetical protein VITISV_021330 [Vitis vinifera]
MTNQLQEHIIGIPVSCQYDKPSPPNGSGAIIPKKMNSMNYRMNNNRKKADNFVDGVREHVRLGLKFSETVKGKLSLGARILQIGGVKRVFKQNFGVREGEKLLKVSQCYLSTTAGPIAGLLFISTQRVAFCSERSIKFSSPNGELVRIHYKVSIPLRKIKRANQGENVKKPSQKYMEIVTMDNFDFWFMGFLNYQKAFSYLRQAISQTWNWHIYGAGHIDTVWTANPGLIYAGEADEVNFFRQPGYSTKNSQIMSKPT